jgi:hypothetical protein
MHDGKEIFSESRTYMPVPQKLGNGTTMGRGPYEKSGMVEDTGLPVNRTVTERFDIVLPVPPGEAATARREVDVSVKLWYLPFGTKNADPFLWRDVSKRVAIGEGK